MPSDQIEHDVPTHCQDDPDRAPVQPIFVHTHVAWPMHLILNAPMLAHPVQELRWCQHLTADHRHFFDCPHLTPAPLTPAPQPADLSNCLPAVLVSQIRSQFARRYRPQFTNLQPSA